MATAPDNSPSDRDVCAGNTHDVVLALARLMGRQAAREAFRAAPADYQSSEARESLAPATTADEE